MAVSEKEKHLSAYSSIKLNLNREAAKELYARRVAAREAADRDARSEPSFQPAQQETRQERPPGQTSWRAYVAQQEPAKPSTAASAAVSQQAGPAQLYGSFMLDQEEFALPALSIREVVNFPDRIVPVPLSPPYLEGIFTLRGMVIPVVNLRRLFDPDAAKADPEQKIAIIDHDQIQVGLLFDSTSEILRVRPEQHSILKYEGKNAQGVISGTLQPANQPGRLLQILEPFALLHIENVPQVMEQRGAGRKNEANRFHLQAERRQCVSFHVGGSCFAFEMKAIREIINVPQLESSVLNSKLCAGSFHFRGGIVPVVNFAALLKAGEADLTNSPDRRLVIARIGKVSVGFLVDSVDDIIKFFPDDVLPIPLLSKARSGMYRGCILRPGAEEVILLDHDSIFSSKEIVDMNRGHETLLQDPADVKAETAKRVNRQVYLTFRLEHVYAVEIKQIREIIDYSDDTIKPPGMPAFMRGILNLRQQMITIVDMRALYAMAPVAQQKDAKILILERGDERFGLVVDSVESIVTVSDNDRYPVPKMMMSSMPAGLRSEMEDVIDLPGEGDARQTFSVFQCDVFLARLAREME